ncbi:MAG TPA: site-2 protease family protein [Ktedonobacteraceae bacterium]|nr:site-2 protease family protein [Ktedonobacteraceae bacterium]
MYTDPGEYADYNDNPYETDYAHPSYYQSDAPVARSAQPVHPLDLSDPLDQHDTYIDPGNSPPASNGYQQALMSEYRGPSSLEGYTVDAGAEQREAAQRGQAEGRKSRKGLLARLGGLGATIGALLLKLKSLAFLLKFGWAGITAVASVAIYAFFFGWPFAIGLVAMLFIHEMGHALVMKLKGIPVGGLIFVPMLGAAVIMRNMPRNARDEAEVGIAGPIAGALAAGVCLFLAQQSPGVQTIWAPLAYFGFFINLFNLIPVVPFDGGRIVAAIDKRMWLVGLVGLAAYFGWSWLNGDFSIWLLFFLILAATQYWSRRSIPDTEEGKAYYNVSLKERIFIGVLYFGLAALLILGMTVSRGLMFYYGG